MIEDWQKVEERWTPQEESGPRVYVSLNKRGEIALSAAAWAAIKEPWNVTLLWDEKRRRIGVKYPVAREGVFFAVRTYGREGRMRVVNAGRLLKQFGVTVERLVVFRDVAVEMHKGEPMLVLNLVKSGKWKMENGK